MGLAAVSRGEPRQVRDVDRGLATDPVQPNRFETDAACQLFPE